LLKDLIAEEDKIVLKNLVDVRYIKLEDGNVIYILLSHLQYSLNLNQMNSLRTS